MDEDREGLVLMLLEEGSRGHAVRLYQEETGVDLDRARSAVADLSRQHGIPTRSSIWLPLLTIALAGLLGVLLAF